MLVLEAKICLNLTGRSGGSMYLQIVCTATYPVYCGTYTYMYVEFRCQRRRTEATYPVQG